VLEEINKREKDPLGYSHMTDDTCLEYYKQPWTGPQENEIITDVNKHANRRYSSRYNMS
jgi:hypothetical protein